MTGPAADAERGTLDGGDADSRRARAGDGVELHYLRWSRRAARHPGRSSSSCTASPATAAGSPRRPPTSKHQGVAVYAPDRRGSGRSGGPARPPRPLRARAGRRRARWCGWSSAEHPGTPLFLAASSWAAKLGVVYAARRPAPLSGLLLLGPGLLPRVSLSRADRLAVVAGHLVAPTARLAIPLTPEMYTANPPYLDFIRADRLRLLQATTRFFWETARLDRAPGARRRRLGLPLLLLQGEDDAMMDVPATRRWFSRLGAEDKTYRAYPGAGHTLDFEPDRGRYLADLRGWLSARVPRAPGRRAGSVDADGDRARSCSRSTSPSRSRSGTPPPRGPPPRACSCGSGWTTAPRAGGSRSRAPMSPGSTARGPSPCCATAILPALLGRTFRSLGRGRARSWRSATARHPPEWVRPEIPQTSAWCSVDLALLDAFGRAFGKPAVGGRRPGAGGRRAAPIPLQRGGVRRPTGGPMRCRCSRCGRSGSRTSSSSSSGTGPGGRHGPPGGCSGRRVDLRVDANMAWDVEQALEVIGELRAVGIQSFEQPIAADDLAGLARLVAESSAGIMVDEGLTDRESLRTLISRRACTGANVRISKCGGLVGAYARCREALDAGLMLQVGCQVGRVVAAVGGAPDAAPALAPLTPGVRYAEGCFGEHLLREDPRHAVGPVRLRRPSSAAAGRGRPRGPGRPGDARAMGRRPGQSSCRHGERGDRCHLRETLLLWATGQRAVRQFDKLSRAPVQSQRAAAAGDPGDQRRHRVRPPSRLRRHRHVPGVPGAGAHLQLRGPGALHQRGDERAAQPADQASAGAVHDHQRDDRGLQVHPDDPSRASAPSPA